MDTRTFIPAHELDPNDDAIFAEYAAGLLQPWRTDCNGVQWFRRMRPIHGVPVDTERHDVEIIEDADTELEGEPDE